MRKRQAWQIVGHSQGLKPAFSWRSLTLGSLMSDFRFGFPFTCLGIALKVSMGEA